MATKNLNVWWVTLIALLCAACAPAQQAADTELVLVAGATGRTGQHVVEQLVAQGYTVRALVRDADAARFRKTLESRGDVDPIAVNVVALDHHVA